ncbi:MAG: DUF983 domain-containing protein [Psychroflexus sp.]|uniref:DUF983 domain-containing protein n=1 Tax=Psychroflexus sp. S27 TaxID=1982757 RepID=UPI000C2AAB92|nr:DUF983 domain-containing protein [Psychroflexus sp. S27]PJX21915.1 DUF983 domain-containing protein [Psychroflexus sp. S27]
MFKGSKLNSMLFGTCPVCHGESMYVEKNPYKITQIFKMHDKCSKCGLKYKIEPSFFFGAMYVSYALGVAFSVASFIITHFFIGMSAINSFYVIIAVLIILMPIIIRLSRNIWINLFINYKGE